MTVSNTNPLRVLNNAAEPDAAAGDEVLSQHACDATACLPHQTPLPPPSAPAIPPAPDLPAFAQ